LIHFYKIPYFLKRITKNLIWNIPTEEKEIFLTFDDGPIPVLTNYILDILDDSDSKATFFCVGDNIKKHNEICESVVKRGHAIENHTFNHLKGWSTKNQDYLMNIEKCQSYVSKHQQPLHKPLFRPPHGQITLSQIKSLGDKYNIIMWDVLAYDFEGSHSAEVSLQKIINKTKPGSIVVFHDNYKAEEKLKYMLPKFLQYFREKGFIFKKLELH
jgi:peptidoglycan/xylan/chitin deacetylase (PgdA/CDA1 family)